MAIKKRRLRLAAAVMGLALAAPQAFAEPPPCAGDADAKSREATIIAFIRAVEAGDAKATRDAMAAPQDYIQTVAGPHSYRDFLPGEVVLRVSHRFHVTRLCTYGGHGDEVMTDAEFTDDAALHMADPRGLSQKTYRFYVFYHFHYTPDAPEGKLRMSSPFIKVLMGPSLPEKLEPVES